MPFFRYLASDWGEHLLFDSGHLDPKLSVGGIFQRICPGLGVVLLRIVQAGTNLTGKEKGSTDTDSSNGVQLVGIEKDFGFKGFGSSPATKPMGTYTVTDGLNDLLTVPGLFQQFSGDFGAALRMAYFSSACALFFSANIVQECRRGEDVATGHHAATNNQGSPQDSLAVIGSVGTPFSEAVRCADFSELLEAIRGAGKCWRWLSKGRTCRRHGGYSLKNS